MKETLGPISEEPIAFGRCVARREYLVGRRLVVLEIGTPREASWGRDHYCAIRITDWRRVTVRPAFGVDSLQALVLAVQLAKILLEAEYPRIRAFPTSSEGDVALPKFVHSPFGLAFQRKLERAAERMMNTETARLKRRRAERAGVEPASPRRSSPVSNRAGTHEPDDVPSGRRRSRTPRQ